MQRATPPPAAPPPPPPPQQQQFASSAAGDPRVGATALRPRTRSPGHTAEGEEARGAARSGPGAGSNRVLPPPAARLEPSQQRPYEPQPQLHPVREQQPEADALQRQTNRVVPSSGASTTLQPRHTGFALRTGLALTFLGTNSGAPTLERNVSCTLVRLPGAVHMVDCGEGTHRQLMSLRGSLDPAEIDGIFITHLHGDHCFGLAAALALLDEVKAADQADPARRRHHVYGPPGLAELVRVSMVATGLTRRLQLPLTVTELVTSPTAAHPPMPLEEALQQRQRGPQRQRRPAGGGAPAGAAANGGGAPVLLQRLAALRVPDAPELKSAVAAVQPRVAALEEIWSPPPPRYPPAGQYGQYGRGSSYSGSESEAPDTDEDDASSAAAGGGGGAAPFHRAPFVAAEGLFWELLGCACVRVRAAQLQHRVPCWGYVFTEARPAEEGTRRRKVVVLGDTVSSRSIAPLAAGCDVMSHEATFARGMEAKARVAQHSTGWMAGAFAAAVGARSLVLTHFSARYREGPRDLDYGRTSSRSTGHLEAEQQSWAVAGLLQEAASTYGRPEHLFAASDFYTHHVPPRPAAAAAAATGSGARGA